MNGTPGTICSAGWWPDLTRDRIAGSRDGAALSPVSTRAVYAGVAEVSIYIAQASPGRGLGSALMSALITASEQAGVWTLQASIFPENAASITLHQKHGFRIVGKRERLGRLRGVWRDTLLLERRAGETACATGI
jgi:L-amino acid N-acyltransferase YncA